MNTGSIDELEIIYTAVLSDVSEYDLADILWDDSTDEDSTTTYDHGSEHRCPMCLFAPSRANSALSAWSELAIYATRNPEFWSVQLLPSLQYSEPRLDFPHTLETLEQQVPTAPVVEEESKEARTEERPATILATNKLFSRTMNGVFYTACLSVVLILGGAFWDSAITVLIGVSVFTMAGFAWLACFTWMGWVFIRFTKQRGWSWIKRSNSQANHPKH